MPTIDYIDWRPRADTVDMIEKTNAVCVAYAAQGFTLTLRQLHYQFVSRGWYDNTFSNYKRLGNAVSKGRRAGLIDWDHVVDRTRRVERLPHWDDPADAIDAIAKQFHIDRWQGQKIRPEVWIEKDALIGVIERVCRANDVSYFACRGNPSDSEVWAGGYGRMALNSHLHDQEPRVFYLGDHDPTGVDIDRDVRERLSLFAGQEVAVDRIALTLDQVEQYDPPPNFAKESDARYQAYVDRFGITDCWELDALDPPVIEALIQDAIDSVRDQVAWDRMNAQEEAQRDSLHTAAERWESVEAFLGTEED